MKNLILGLIVCFLGLGAYAQEYGQKVGSLSVAVEGKKAKDFLYKDQDVEITVSRISVNQVDFNIKNLTNTPIDFLWSDSYYISSGKSTPFVNGGNAVELLTGISSKEVNSVSPKIRIAPETFISIRASSKEVPLFDFNYANKSFKETGEVPHNTAILTLESQGEIKEKKVKFQMYTSRINRSLRK